MRHYTKSNQSSCLALEVIAGKEIKKDALHAVLQSEEKSGAVFKDMCNSCAVKSRMKQCIPDTLWTRRWAVLHMLLEQLDY